MCLPPHLTSNPETEQRERKTCECGMKVLGNEEKEGQINKHGRWDEGKRSRGKEDGQEHGVWQRASSQHCTIHILNKCLVHWWLRMRVSNNALWIKKNTAMLNQKEKPCFNLISELLTVFMCKARQCSSIEWCSPKIGTQVLPPLPGERKHFKV